MATENHAAHGHEHGHGAGGDHVPHVLDLKVYFGVFAALIIFTVITVGVSYIDLGSANLFIALLVATCKALMVAAIFMHLAFDKKFNAIIFAFSLVFLAIFIGFTMFDTNYRGLGGRLEADRPADVTQPFAGSREEAAIKAEWQGGGEKKGGGEKHEGKAHENEGGKATEGGVPGKDEHAAPTDGKMPPQEAAPAGGAAPAPAGGTAPAPAGGEAAPK